VAALKHKLLQKLPRALAAAAADQTAATAAAGAAVPSVGVQLLLWHPSGSSSSSSEGYSRVFADVAARWGSSSSNEVATVGLGFAAWQSFTQR
jgi:hypothetical protein